MYIALLFIVFLVFMLYLFKDKSSMKQLQGTIRVKTKQALKWLVKSHYMVSKLLFGNIKPDGVKPDGTAIYRTRKLAIAISTSVIWLLVVAIVAFNLNAIADGILAALS